MAENACELGPRRRRNRPFSLRRARSRRAELRDFQFSHKNTRAAQRGVVRMIELISIVSSFNRAPLLKEALSSLVSSLEHLTVKSAIVVIDAGSVDGSQAIVR